MRSAGRPLEDADLLHVFTHDSEGAVRPRMPGGLGDATDRWCVIWLCGRGGAYLDAIEHGDTPYMRLVGNSVALSAVVRYEVLARPLASNGRIGIPSLTYAVRTLAQHLRARIQAWKASGLRVAIVGYSLGAKLVVDLIERGRLNDADHIFLLDMWLPGELIAADQQSTDFYPLPQLVELAPLVRFVVLHHGQQWAKSSTEATQRKICRLILAGHQSWAATFDRQLSAQVQAWSESGFVRIPSFASRMTLVSSSDRGGRYQEGSELFCRRAGHPGEVVVPDSGHMDLLYGPPFTSHVAPRMFDVLGKS